MAIPIQSTNSNSNPNDSISKKRNPSSNCNLSSKKRLKLSSSASSSSFSTLTLPHPLGLKPLGNSLLATTNAKSNLGYLYSFPDDLILHLLSFLDQYQLLSLSRTCHALYVFTNQDQLWKDLFLLKSNGGHLQTWRGNWKKTFLVQFHKEEISNSQASMGSFQNLIPPIKTKDLFSDVLFHPFRMSFTPLSVLYSTDYPDTFNHNSKHIPIQRIHSDDYSVESFNKEFSIPSIPCIIKPSSKPIQGRNQNCLEWNYESMLKRWSNRIFRAEAITTTLETYVQYSKSCETHFKRGRSVESSKLKPPLPLSPTSTSSSTSEIPNRPFDPYSIPDDSPFYLFDSDFPKEMDEGNEWLIPELLEFSHLKTSQIEKEILIGDGDEEKKKEVEELKRKRMEMDLFGLLGEQRPEYRWIIAGPERSGSGVSIIKISRDERSRRSKICQFLEDLSLPKVETEEVIPSNK